MKLYATIRKESEYHNQQEFGESGNPIAFPVKLLFEDDPFFPVRGGIGKQYSLFDVELFTKSEGEFVKLPVHSHEYRPQIFKPEL